MKTALTQIGILYFLMVLFTSSLTLSAADSPTGRNPKLAWTPEQQDIWNRMRSENDPWWQLIKAEADKPAEPGALGSGEDHGEWCVLAYQITGDITYAQKAMTRLRGVFNTGWQLDNTREFQMDFAIFYDWLKPALTAQDKADFLTCLNKMGDAAIAAFGRTNWWEDSDQVTGNYFGLLALYYATNDDNPKAAELYNHSLVGGTHSTGANHENLRNTLSLYCKMASGGEWVEGSEYNNGTTRLLMIGYYMAQTVLGHDDFTEIKSFIQDLGKCMIYSHTSNLDEMYVWGNVAHGRAIKETIREWTRPLTIGIAQGLTQGNPDVGVYIAGLMDDMITKYGRKLYFSANRMFYVYNPYASKDDWRKLQPGYKAPGQGIIYYHHGWQNQDALVGLHIRPTQGYVDHKIDYYGNFQIYRKGEWAVTHPICYGATSEHSETANAFLAAGLSSMEESKLLIAQETGTDYAYTAGENSGRIFPEGYYLPTAPVSFVPEWTRSMLYLPSGDNTSETIIIHDRTNVLDPTKLQNYENYWPTHKSSIENALKNYARKQVLFHSSVSPTLDGTNAFHWSTTGGQTVSVKTLIPSTLRRMVINEATDTNWDNIAGLGDWDKPESDELKWQVRLMPDADRDWDTYLNVVQVSDNGVTLTNTLVHSSSNEAEGVLVQGIGRNNCLAMFNAQQSLKKLNTGYTVTWTASTNTDVYLAHLDPALVWTSSIDGGAANPLTISEGGLGRLTVTGSGSHTLTLNVTGTMSLPGTPANLAATAKGSGQVYLIWTDNATNEYGYKLEISTDGTTFNQAALVHADTVHYTAMGLEGDKDYYFRVRAYNPAGNSEWSNVAQVKTLPSTHVNEYIQQGSLSIYNNPVNNIARFIINSNQTANIVITIYNLSGTRVAALATGNLHGGKELVWDCSKVPAGVYLAVASGQGVMVQKLKIIVLH